MPTLPGTTKTETAPDFLSMIFAASLSFAGTALLLLLIEQAGRIV